MRVQSAKAKGRRLQQFVRDLVLQCFPELEPEDVRSISMGAAGADLLLSPAAKKKFPFSVECKNQESLSIWQALAQAEANAGGTAPLLVFKRNHSKTYVALEITDFMGLLKEKSHAEEPRLVSNDFSASLPPNPRSATRPGEDSVSAADGPIFSAGNL